MIDTNIVARYRVNNESFHLLDDGRVGSYRGSYDTIVPIDEWRSLEDFKAECQSVGMIPTLVLPDALSGKYWPLWGKRVED